MLKHEPKISLALNFLFGAYLTAVVFVDSLFESRSLSSGGYASMLFTFAAMCVFCIAIPKIRMAVERLSFKGRSEPTAWKKLSVFAIFFAVTFCVLFVQFLAYKPGCFSPDSISQYGQAVTGKYNDWHPAWHTLVFFTLPLKLTGRSAMIVFLQIGYFSILMGYIALTIYLYAGTYAAVILTMVIMLNPLTFRIVMYPWKDVAFAMAGTLCMAFVVHIYFTRGAWCGRWWRTATLAVAMVNTTLFRHNAILFTLPLAAALFFFMPRRRWIALCVSFILLLGAIKIPLYRALDVGKPGSRTMETMGFPLSVITYVAKNVPQRMDKETEEFVDELVSHNPDVLARCSINGFNSIKWGGVNEKAVEAAGKKKIVRMMLRCFCRAPKQSLQATFGLMRCVFSFEYQSRVGMEIRKNSYGIEWRGKEKARSASEAYSSLMYKSPLKYCASIGLTIAIMLSFMLFKSDFKNRGDWKRLFLCAPIFAYDFGTMLLLTGHDVRFFFITFLVCPLVVTLMTGSTQFQGCSAKK